jgi:predicted GNAT family acetyltransferase
VTARTVRRDEAASRYELVEDGRVVGVADFRDRGDVVVLPHTEIDADRQGHGLGAELVAGVLDDLRRRGVKVEPACWYVRDFLDANPAYQDLLAG